MAQILEKEIRYTITGTPSALKLKSIRTAQINQIIQIVFSSPGKPTGIFVYTALKRSNTYKKAINYFKDRRKIQIQSYW